MLIGETVFFCQIGCTWELGGSCPVHIKLVYLWTIPWSFAATGAWSIIWALAQRIRITLAYGSRYVALYSFCFSMPVLWDLEAGASYWGNFGTRDRLLIYILNPTRRGLSHKLVYYLNNPPHPTFQPITPLSTSHHPSSIHLQQQHHH